MVTAENVTNGHAVAGSDGHAYLACWSDKRKWFAERSDAFATDAPMIVQRCMRGRRRGQEWTVRGGW